MKCQRCESERILKFSGKTSDLFSCYYMGKEHQGYVPKGIGINDKYRDYLQGRLCMECGQVQGEFPVPGPDIEDDEEEEL